MEISWKCLVVVTILLVSGVEVFLFGECQQCSGWGKVRLKCIRGVNWTVLITTPCTAKRNRISQTHHWKQEFQIRRQDAGLDEVEKKTENALK